MESLIVTKFGGSSLSNSSQFEKVRSIMEADKGRRILVPSAPGKDVLEKHKVTDLLLMCHQLASHKLHFEEIFQLVENRFITIKESLKIDLDIEDELYEVYNRIDGGADVDYCASRGEYLNGKLLAAYLGFQFIDAADVIFIRDGKADMTATAKALKAALKEVDNAVIPGFYGTDEQGKIKTFSRGGSDITGAIVAASIDADLYENWTDVSGFLIADPKIVKNSKPIKAVTYRELRELSYMGAPVLHEESVFPVREKKIPIHIRNTNCPDDDGTIILAEEKAPANPGIITGISGKKDYSVIRIEKTRMSDDLSFYRKLISVFETNDIHIEHMPTSIDTISVVVSTKQIEGREKKISEEISIYCNPDQIVINKGMSIIAVVGRGMINQKGTSATVFSSLAKSGINIRMISQGSSELNIIVGVENEDFEKAISAIYDAFERSVQ